MKPPESLIPVYEKRKQRTVKLVAEAIKMLEQKGIKVSYSSIRSAVSEMTGGKIRISETTLYRNADAQALYVASAVARPKSISDPIKLYLAHSNSSMRAEEIKAISRLQRKSKAQIVVTARQYELEVHKPRAELAHLRADILEGKILASGSVDTSGVTSNARSM